MIAAYFTGKRRLIRKLVQGNFRWPGLLIGVLSAYTFPMISYTARLMGHAAKADEFVQMAVIFPLKSLLFFAGSACLVSIIARVFGGKWKPLPFACAAGWAGLLWTVSLLLILPALEAGAASAGGGSLSQPFLVFAVLLVLAALLVLVEYVRLNVIIISEIFEMKIMRSFFVWLISAVPLFIIYSRIVKV